MIPSGIEPATFRCVAQHQKKIRLAVKLRAGGRWMVPVHCFRDRHPHHNQGCDKSQNHIGADWSVSHSFFASWPFSGCGQLLPTPSAHILWTPSRRLRPTTSTGIVQTIWEDWFIETTWRGALTVRILVNLVAVKHWSALLHSTFLEDNW